MPSIDSPHCANGAVAALSEATGDAIFRGHSSFMHSHASCGEGGSTYALHAIHARRTDGDSSRTSIPRATVSSGCVTEAAQFHPPDNLDGLLRLRSKPNVAASLYAKWLALRRPPPPPSVMEWLPEAVVLRVVDFLGPDSVAAVHLAATHRRMRLLLLRYGRTPVVSLAPTLIARDRLDDPATMHSMRCFFSTHTRGQHVRELALVEPTYVSALVPHSNPNCTMHTPAATDTSIVNAHDDDITKRIGEDTAHGANIDDKHCAKKHTMRRGAYSLATVVRMQRIWPMLAQMPCLTQLDVRGVTWSAPSLFLADLYLVAPQLRVLKMTETVFVHWTAGWWQRLSALERMVVGSRRESSRAVASMDWTAEACVGEGVGSDCANTTTTTTRTTSSSRGVGARESIHAASPPTHSPMVDIHPDCIVMLRGGSSSDNNNINGRIGHCACRMWSLTLWCPLTLHSLRQLITPATPLPSLVELLVNVQGNADAPSLLPMDAVYSAARDVTSVTSAGGAEMLASESADVKRVRSSRRVTAAVDVALPEIITLPRLTSLTVVDVQERPAIAAELYLHMRKLAPTLRYFNVVNTTRPATVEKLKSRRHHATRMASDVIMQ